MVDRVYRWYVTMNVDHMVVGGGSGGIVSLGYTGGKGKPTQVNTRRSRFTICASVVGAGGGNVVVVRNRGRQTHPN